MEGMMEEEDNDAMSVSDKFTRESRSFACGVECNAAPKSWRSRRRRL
jgi:hypothetical protein